MRGSALSFIRLAVMVSACAAAVPALELSLEENKSESGTIGYVDIDRVFKDFSGTANARGEFLAEIKAKEDSLNLKKQAIFSLKADIAKLKQEREFSLTLPDLMRQAEEISAATANINQNASTQTAAGAPAGAEGLPANLPGMGGVDMPGVNRVPANYFKFSVSTSAAEIDAAIAGKELDLAKKQEDLNQAQRQTERELLEYETHKSEIILGRIYLALKELAVKEGVSVVVDKRSILFGHSAVDLTGKLIEKLEGTRL